ncbi:MAG: SocA family protein [Acidobacteria bacterium]|nr:SocA family protein [Acidobacteriota bacterium]
MGISTAANVAARLINLAHEKASPVSNLKLQKLLYYSQAWHLALFKKPLFNDEIEAWVHGPVVPQVFRFYRDYKWASISKGDPSTLRSNIEAHLEEVWRAYGHLSGYDLERLTHSEDPWRQARQGIAPDESSHAVISKESMQRFYASRLNGKA